MQKKEKIPESQISDLSKEVLQNDLYVEEEQLIKKLVKESSYFKYNLSVIKNRLQSKQIRFYQTEI